MLIGQLHLIGTPEEILEYTRLLQGLTTPVKDEDVKSINLRSILSAMDEE